MSTLILLTLVTIGASHFTTLTHELSHALFVKICGGTILSIKPYPHREKGHFYLGKVVFSFSHNTNIAPVFFSPVISSITFSIIFFLLSLLISDILLIFAILQLVDLIDWLKDYFKNDRDGSDGFKYRHHIEKVKNGNKLDRQDRKL